MSAWPDALAGREEGSLVVLEPLAPEHEPGLLAAAADRSVWDFMPAVPATAADAYAAETPARFRAWMEGALAESAAGREGAFVVLDRESGVPIGSTRYLTLRPDHGGLEIGWTWLGKPWWRTGANVETKLLLLTRAFERLGCERVELKPDRLIGHTRALDRPHAPKLSATPAWPPTPSPPSPATSTSPSGPCVAPRPKA